MGQLRIVQLVAGIFVVQCLGVAILGARMPGFSLRRWNDLSDDARAGKLRKVRMLNAVAGVMLLGFVVAITAIDHYLQHHPGGAP